MRTRGRQHQPRGFILIAVLVIILVLGVAAAAYLAQAGQTGRTSQAASGQQMAVMRAQGAAMDAVRSIRANEFDVHMLVPRPAPAGATDCANVNCVMRVSPSGGDVLALREGGGLQWEWVIYKSAQAGVAHNRYMIQADGFYGYSDTSSNFTTARVEVEIDVGDVLSTEASEYGSNSGGL